MAEHDGEGGRVEGASVGRQDFAVERQHVAIERREAGDGCAAGAVERRLEGALAEERELAAFVIEHACHFAGMGVGLANLDADDALAQRRQPILGIEHLRGASGETETLETREREENRVHFALVELSQPRIDIAAQQHDVEIGTGARGLRVAAHGGRAETSALRQIGQRLGLVGEERFAGILAFEKGAERQARRQGGRHVLHRMDGEIDLVLQERVFQFLDEESLAAGIGQAPVLDAVAGGLEDHDLAGTVFRGEAALHHVGLHERELRATGSKTKGAVLRHGCKRSRDAAIP